jgi:hypothetical protein
METSTTKRDLQNGAEKAREGVKSAAEQIREFAKKYDLESAEQRAEDMLAAPAAFIKKYPLGSVLGAVSVGFLFGSLRRKD